MNWRSRPESELAPCSRVPGDSMDVSKYAAHRKRQARLQSQVFYNP